MTRAALTWALLWVGLASAVAAGIVAGFLVLRLVAPDVARASAFSSPAPSSSPMVPVQPALVTPAPSASGVLEPVTPVASVPRSASTTGTKRTAAVQPSAPSPATARPVPPVSAVAGTASWFRSPLGVSAAGPRLRTALGPGWRGTLVRVCTPTACTATILGDWMRADRLIDLDAPVFAALAPLSRGLVTVTVRRLP